MGDGAQFAWKSERQTHSLEAQKQDGVISNLSWQRQRRLSGRPRASIPPRQAGIAQGQATVQGSRDCQYPVSSTGTGSWTRERIWTGKGRHYRPSDTHTLLQRTAPRPRWPHQSTHSLGYSLIHLALIYWAPTRLRAGQALGRQWNVTQFLVLKLLQLSDDMKTSIQDGAGGHWGEDLCCVVESGMAAPSE